MYGVVVCSAPVSGGASGSTVLLLHVVCRVSDDACASVSAVSPLRRCSSVRASTVLLTVWPVHLSTCCESRNTYIGVEGLAVTGSTSGVLSPRVGLQRSEQYAKHVEDVCASVHVAVSAGGTEV